MKLRNKKTGEIGNLKSFSNDKRVYVWIKKETELDYIYDSLAELNEEWEDYEEAKGCWIINIFGVVEYTHFRNGAEAELLKEIGNYFKTKEEAEKAVEKLKAWKQLKDACNFRFNGVERDKRGMLIGVKVEFDKVQVPFDTARRCIEILCLLFGGEDE